MNLGVRTFGHSSVRLTHFRPEGASKELAAIVRGVSDIFTEPAHRRTGCAARMMQKVCQQADAAGFALVLAPEPADDEPMDRNDLESWFTRLGFQRFQNEPVMMFRRARPQ